MKNALVLGVVLTSVTGCFSRTMGRQVAAEAIHCPPPAVQTFVPHSYNLGAGEHVYRGCGRDAIVQCTWSTGGDSCVAVYVSPHVPSP